MITPMDAVGQKFRNYAVEIARLFSMISGVSAGEVLRAGGDSTVGVWNQLKAGHSTHVSVAYVGCWPGSQPGLLVTASAGLGRSFLVAWWPSSRSEHLEKVRQKLCRLLGSSLGSHKCHFHDPHKSTQNLGQE